MSARCRRPRPPVPESRSQWTTSSTQTNLGNGGSGGGGGVEQPTRQSRIHGWLLLRWQRRRRLRPPSANNNAHSCRFRRRVKLAAIASEGIANSLPSPFSRCCSFALNGDGSADLQYRPLDRQRFTRPLHHRHCHRSRGRRRRSRSLLGAARYGSGNGFVYYSDNYTAKLATMPCWPFFLPSTCCILPVRPAVL